MPPEQSFQPQFQPAQVPPVVDVPQTEPQFQPVQVPPMADVTQVESNFQPQFQPIQTAPVTNVMPTEQQFQPVQPIQPLPTVNQSSSALKIFVAVMFVALSTGSAFGFWKYNQVKKLLADNLAGVPAIVATTTQDVSQSEAVSATSSDTLSGSSTNLVVNINDKTLISSSGADIKISGSLTIKDKITFSKDQLAAFKSDMTELYLRYKNQDTNVEPLKSKYVKEMDAIFLKDLAVPEVSKNPGILFYPEIAKILADIKSVNSVKQNVQINNTGSNNITVSLLVSDSPSKEGQTNINIKAESKYYAYWKSTNADKATLGGSLSECLDKTLNREIPAESKPVESYESDVLPVSMVGCKINLVLTVSDTSSGKQEIAKSVITVIK